MSDDRNDPNSSEYVPPPPAPGAVGTAGHGSDFGADLYALYLAGRVDFPELAGRYSHLATSMSTTTPLVEAEVGRVGSAGGAVLGELLDMQDSLHGAFFHTTLNLRDVGVALVQTADTYVAADEEAYLKFTELMAGDRDILADDTPTVPTPPGPYDDGAGDDAGGGGEAGGGDDAGGGGRAVAS